MVKSKWSNKEFKNELEPEDDLVAEDATLNNAWKQEEYIGRNGRSTVHSRHSKFKLIIK